MSIHTRIVTFSGLFFTDFLQISHILPYKIIYYFSASGQLPNVHNMLHNKAYDRDAAAVTDDVSLIAVPAKIPNDSPCNVSNPIAFPSSGKKIAASTLKKKMTAIDCAISSSSAPMTGAVAAIAEPPQIEAPTPTSIDVFAGTLSTFYFSQYARQ